MFGECLLLIRVILCAYSRIPLAQQTCRLLFLSLSAQQWAEQQPRPRGRPTHLFNHTCMMGGCGGKHPAHESDITDPRPTNAQFSTQSFGRTVESATRIRSYRVELCTQACHPGEGVDEVYFIVRACDGGPGPVIVQLPFREFLAVCCKHLLICLHSERSTVFVPSTRSCLFEQVAHMKQTSVAQIVREPWDRPAQQGTSRRST